MAEHLSVSELEGEAKKLKRDLERWREVILPINSILLWEKNSYLGIIAGTTTVLFFLLWQMDPSFLTMLSFIGIIITLIDYLVPKLTLHFTHPDKWTSTQERKLESICKSLAVSKIFLTNSFNSFWQMKREHPTYYYTIVLVTLFILSWIGNIVNNLFLTYVVVTGLLLFPGVQHRGLIDKYTANLQRMIKERMKNAANLKAE